MGPQPSPEFLALQQVVAGRYSLERELGRGGMGIVFLARDVALDRPVAIKLLPPTLAPAPDLRVRFLREARTAAKLSHPNISPIHLVEERDDLVYFVMAFVAGESLGQRIRRRGALPPSQVGRIVQQVAWALAYAHQQGVVHRDIKPDNILLEEDTDRAVVTDFGIARVAEASAVTGRGELVGTVHYMSPEQATGDPVDGRSDLYALGVTAFYALTGRLPFEGDNLPALIHQHVTVAPPRLARVAPRVPPRLAEAVDRCLAKSPEGRFRTAEDLAAAVGASTSARKEVPPEIRRLLRHMRDTGVVVGGITVALAWLYWLLDDVLAQLWSSDPVSMVVLGVLVAGVALRFLQRLLQMTRDVIRQGWGLGDVRGALLAEGEMLSEEQELEGRAEARIRREKKERWIRRAPIWFLLFGAAQEIFYLVSDESFHAVSGALMILAGLVLLGAGPAVDGRSPIAALPTLERMLVGRLGRLLFGVAGLGLSRQEATAARATQHTEAFLASAADGIFDRLPSEVRRRFPRLPEVIKRLEADANALRQREEALSRAIAEAAPPGAARSALADQRRGAVDDLEAARARVRERLEHAVGALEAIRLDLLRLHAGIGSPDDLTADLEKAREVNDAVNAELAGRAEVARLVGTTGA